MKRIGVAMHADAGRRLTIEALAGVVGFEWIECDFDPDDRSIDAWIIPEARAEDVPSIVAADRPCFVVLTGDPRGDPQDRRPIRFSSSSDVPRVLAGRLVTCSQGRDRCDLPADLPITQTLAFQGDDRVWATHATPRRRHHFTSEAIPALVEREPIFRHFDQDGFFGLLPLLAFLQEVVSDPGWEGPPLQACFMFDDPNLHWSTYGFLDFEEFADHAEAHGYHGSFATIPLDGWFIHERTARLFRSRADRISLLMHGNDHVNHELARDMDASERLRLLSQALWRIEALERRAKVEVARVMAPPHGACSEATLHAMATLGYEAACISRGSLAAFNANAPWLRGLGMRPSDIIGGLPVLPRFRISATCQNAVLVAALLRQPIVPVGHHQDVAAGLDLFANLADDINGLGPVHWRDMKSIARAQFSQKVDGKILRVRMHSTRVDVRVPPGIEAIHAERGWRGASVDELHYSIAGRRSAECPNDGEPIEVKTGDRVAIDARPRQVAPASRASYAGARPWPIVRRVLTEVRDRLAPHLAVLRGRS